MLENKELRKKQKKDLIFIILRLHVLIVLLIGVFWSRNLLKKKSLKKTDPLILERKARLLPEDLKKNQVK